MRDPREGCLVDREVGLFGGLAHRGAACRGLEVGRALTVGVVDATAREDPHAPERELRVLPEHQRLDAVGRVADEHDGRRGDGVAFLALPVAQPAGELALVEHAQELGWRGSRPAAR